jgi:hypothetical protein
MVPEVIGIYPLVNVYITMEHHHFQWENQLLKGPFSIAMLNYQRVWMVVPQVGKSIT